MSPTDRDTLKTKIQTAFGSVQLGEGIGLWEAQGIDDYASAEQIAQLRRRDERMNWATIPVADLNNCYSSLSFFDCAGMRFCLPAFLIAELDGTFDNSTIFTLTYSENASQFSCFSPAQIQAVRAFLLSCLRDPSYEFDWPQIEWSLEFRWRNVQSL